MLVSPDDNPRSDSLVPDGGQERVDQCSKAVLGSPFVDKVADRYVEHAFVTLTFAQSLDERTATATGDSQWISGAVARRFAHRLRSEHDVILVGIGTVLSDDPQLTVRHVNGRDPLRIVVDSRLRIPLSSLALANGAATHTIVVTSKDADVARMRAITKMGAETLQLARSPNHSGVDLTRLFEELGRRGIASVLAEGGKGIITSLIAAGAVDRLATVIAPKLIGQGIEAIGDLGVTRLNAVIAFSSTHIRRLGADILFDGRLSTEDTNRNNSRALREVSKQRDRLVASLG